MKRFEKAKEIVQSDQFGNVIDFFTAVRETKGNGVQPAPQVVTVKKEQDYTPLLILGAVAVIVALIKK
jgi:hypothetical protein